MSSVIPSEPRHTDNEPTLVVVENEQSVGDWLGQPKENHRKGDVFKKGGEKDVSNGPMSSRRCTDITCLFLFLVAIFAFIGIQATGFILGDHRKLFYGKDNNGDYCGISDLLVTYPRAIHTINVSRTSDIGELLHDPVTAPPLHEELTANLQTVCTTFTACPTADIIANLRNDPNARRVNVGGLSVAAFSLSVCPYTAEHCVPLPTDYQSISAYYCVPSLGDKALEHLGSGWNYLDQWSITLASVEETWPMIPLMALMAFVIGIIYLFLVQMCASICAWVMVGTFLASFAVGGAALFVFAKLNVDTLPPQSYQASYWGAIAVWSLGGVMFIVVICLFNRIVEGSAILKSAALFVRSTPWIYSIPTIFFVAELSLLLFFIFGSFFTFTMSGFATWEIGIFFASSLFCYLWIEAWMTGMCQVIMAGAVGWWYFTPVDEDGNKHAEAPVWKATKIAFKYHTGSIAFGACLLALIRLLKWGLRYLKYQAAAQAANPQNACKACLPCGLGALCGLLTCANSCVVWVVWSLSYLVECFERCLEFLTKQAYIQIAIQGKNFCASSWEAFTLVLRNPGRFAVAHCMGRMIVLLGVLVVGSACGATGYFITVGIYKDKISNAVMPTAIYVLVGIGITVVILSILSMTVDSVLHCYLADREMSGEPEFAPKPLRDFMERKVEGDEEGEEGGCCYCCG